MPANVIDFMTSLIYGDMGSAELGAAAPPLPPGALNHLRWTLDKKPSSGAITVTGTEFLVHHVDYMLARYEAWRSKYFLPPVRPWNGQNVFPDHQGSPPVGPALPVTLNGSPFPAGWTTNDLGTAVRIYYNSLRHFLDASFNATEMNQDEIKAPFSYRYWAFVKWVSDLRKRLNFQPVIPVSTVYDKDGIILTEKDFTDVFHMVHHVWHPNGVGAPWIIPTPYFKTSVGQHARKKEISRTQVGAEFFKFHRDHLEIYDRWLARTGQVPVVSRNICAHDTAFAGSPPAGVEADASGYPKVRWDLSATNPPVELNPPHVTYWNGNLAEFSNLGLMGQRFATDNNPFFAITVPGTSDSGYHGEGHILNGDLIEPVANNHVPRFFAWHGHIDELWQKRRPDFTIFEFVMADSSLYPNPKILTIVRDLLASTDILEPANAFQGINTTNGQGTLRVKLNVRQDPFSRPLQLELRCEVLREAVSNTPVITISRTLTMTTGAPGGANERPQNTDFVEQFIFDGTAGTIDSDGQGPFASDNLLFMPTSTGFKNSAIRVIAYLTCHSLPNGTIPPITGTVSSNGTTLIGSGTLFTTQLNQGDLIRANGQVRMAALINSNTSLTLLDPFPTNLPLNTLFERLDGFDFESVIELPLIQEKQAPEITVYLDRSSFSKDQVDAIATAGTSVFENSFYVILQDRTSRAATIAWPATGEMQLRNLIAPPVYAAGLHTDLSHHPEVELHDLTNNPVPGLSVSITAVNPEYPGKHPGIPQRITYSCRVTFTGNAAFGTMIPGDPPQDLKLVITATDRAGNKITDDTKRVRLQVDANPYMLDGPVSWLSTDTRVFKIVSGQTKFGVPPGWTNPNTFIKQVIQNLRAGNGTAGGDSFDALPTDQEGALLEYSTTVNGVTWYNFALSKIRLQSQTGANGVRASFRLFRWGVANVEFDNTLAYRSAASGVALLGKTTSNELASIPFFAETRVAVSTDMNSQTDDTNSFDFGATGGAGAISYFGAFLDLNESTPRFPSSFTGDGGFGAGIQSVRTLLVGNHQCMIVEVMYALDPTANGATPGTSDNLSQRNLLIVQTANPGDEITRTVQHPFDIDLTRKRKLHVIHDDMHKHRHSVHSHLNPDENCCGPVFVMRPFPKIMDDSTAHAPEHMKGGWFSEYPELLAKRLEQGHMNTEAREQWQFDVDNWKSGLGLDELAIFWNNLPKDSIVDLYLPSLSVADVFNFRSLRHAPVTVKILDNHTLRLIPNGVTFIPVPPFWGDNLAAMITVQLPAGIKKGQRYKVDVLQIRADEARVLGGFQLNVKVENSHDLHEKEIRMLELFHQRLSLTPVDNRWWPILEKQVDFTRKRAKGFIDLSNKESGNDPKLVWNDPTKNQNGQRIKVILEKIQVTDDLESWFKGKGEFQFYSKVSTPDNGGQEQNMKFPLNKYYKLSDKADRNEIVLNETFFEGYVENNLFVQIGGVGLATFDPDDKLCIYKRRFRGNPRYWIGSYNPESSQPSAEDIGGWMVWYRIEYAG